MYAIPNASYWQSFRAFRGDLDVLTPAQAARDFGKEFQKSKDSIEVGRGTRIFLKVLNNGSLTRYTTCNINLLIESTAKFNYLEIPGGHHAFHVIPSPRSWYTTIAVAEWLSFNFDPQGPRDQGASTSDTGRKIQVHELVEWWTE